MTEAKTKKNYNWNNFAVTCLIPLLKWQQTLMTDTLEHSFFMNTFLCVDFGSDSETFFKQQLSHWWLLLLAQTFNM